MKKAWLACALLASAVLPLAAQSNELLDQILEQPQASFGQTAYLILTAVKLLPEQASVDQAVQTLEQQGWKIKIRPAQMPLSLGEYSFLLMKAFGLKGGILYSLFPGPRYACRELVYLKLISGKASPYRKLGGEEAVRILGNVIAYQEGRS